MTSCECTREQDLLDALASSRWPHRCDSDLTHHVSECALCSDTLAVAVPLLLEGEIAHADAQVPSSGMVWWRAQMRARHEAARAASSPITVVGAAACALAAVLVAAALLRAVPGIRQWLSWGRGMVERVAIDGVNLTAVQALAPSGLIGWGVLAVWLILAPLAAYLAFSSDSR